MRLLSNQEKVDMDKYTIEDLKVPSIILMENAAQSVFNVIKKEIKKNDKILVLTGKGNNGGDGFALARILKIKSYNVELYKIYEPKTKDARKNSKLCKIYSVESVDSKNLNIEEYDVFIDAVFGTGFKGILEDRIQNVFNKINNSSGLEISIDIPSGISGDNNEISPNCFNADKTITFEYPVLAHCLYPGKKFVGKLFVEPIGLKYNKELKKEVLEEKDLYLKPLKYDVHKYSRGQVSVIDGIRKYSGATYLTLKAALKAGAGYVRLITDGENRFKNILFEIVIKNISSYEKIKLNSKIAKGILVAGPGMGRKSDKLTLLNKIFSDYKNLNLVLDADALYYFNDYYKKNIHNVIITPHLGEFSRMIDKNIEEIRENPIKIGSEFAAENNLTLILKSETTMIFSEDGRVAVNNFGNPYMATAGSGDVLTGIIAGLWANQSFKNFEIAKKAVGLHSLIGDYLYKNKIFNFTSSDIIDNISNVLKRFIDADGRFSNDC
ncbi:MAG: NAD(P)H-hydrate dehydratase [Candidatus Mcinerneyibacterium aminivorans]|uniref:Bifunctional NAD(P)H-hydrate repair enzyme n=1 Tax=Candidatus Mcinerneyibacterium aminivorans TaxID=2703815 RepID=A0A5D0MAG8_9BACT|nr:MAG: NAD(P)H-hydrate dehydratase [Candidatus Mcinerneyibacterium aminivorans]